MKNYSLFYLHISTHGFQGDLPNVLDTQPIYILQEGWLFIGYPMRARDIDGPPPTQQYKTNKAPPPVTQHHHKNKKKNLI